MTIFDNSNDLAIYGLLPQPSIYDEGRTRHSVMLWQNTTRAVFLKATAHQQIDHLNTIEMTDVQLLRLQWAPTQDREKVSLQSILDNSNDFAIFGL